MEVSTCRYVGFPSIEDWIAVFTGMTAFSQNEAAGFGGGNGLYVLS